MAEKSADEIAKALANSNTALASLTFKNTLTQYESRLPDDQYLGRLHQLISTLTALPIRIWQQDYLASRRTTGQRYARVRSNTV